MREQRERFGRGSFRPLNCVYRFRIIYILRFMLYFIRKKVKTPYAGYIFLGAYFQKPFQIYHIDLAES